MCALNQVPFDAGILTKQFPPPHVDDVLIQGARALGFRIKRAHKSLAQLERLSTPLLALLEHVDSIDELGHDQDSVTEPTTEPSERRRAVPALITDVSGERIVYFEAGTNTPREMPLEAFAERFLGDVFLIAKERPAVDDPDGDGTRSFGFRWFIPALLKHKKVWRDVLTASLVIQLLALGTPIFTQTIIDKVVVHRTESTLIVIAIGMVVFMVFSALLSWVRQYLVLHTGNRVDAVLAAAVFDHLFKLPPRYFEKRPTGVIAARLHGVETIREFIASAAVTLILDLPFLLIFVGIMFWYSVQLTLIALAILAVITSSAWQSHRSSRRSSTISSCSARGIKPSSPNISPVWKR